jgi:hypothetical protein
MFSGFQTYDARIRMVYVEASHDLLQARNRDRIAVVSDAAMERILDRWEVPDPTEAQQVEWWINGHSIRLAIPGLDLRIDGSAE